MPFGPEFDPIYNGFIKEALTEAGFSAARADDIKNQQHILRDIVEQLDSSDLIVADLTGANANVFYELALAHAFQKPCILITQDLEDVPFDLRPYRVLVYSTHFAEIADARQELTVLARGLLSGETRFGSPVSDFRRGQEERGLRPARHQETSPEKPDDRGFVDHVELIENGYEELKEIILRVGELNETMGGAVGDATEDLQHAQAARENIPYGHLRRITRKLAGGLDSFTEEMIQLNERYEEIAKNTDNSLEFLVSFAGLAKDEHPDAVRELLDTLRAVRGQGESAKLSLSELATTMDETPRLEKDLARSTRNASSEIKKMADNVDLTLASISRALDRGDDILKE